MIQIRDEKQINVSTKHESFVNFYKRNLIAFISTLLTLAVLAIFVILK